MKQLFSIIAIAAAVFSQGLLGLQKESDHFIFYYEASDSSVVDTITFRLEGSYDRILADLQLIVNGKIGVHIYPTLQEFHNAIGWPDAPDWLVGVGWTEIHVVSPLNPGPAHSYEEIMDNVFIHEFTHICTRKINQNLPIWLNEGFACYEGGPYYDKASVVAVYNRFGRIPALDELNSSYDNFVNFGGYPLCLTISTFIVVTYGMEKMSDFIRTPGDYTIFSGLTKNEFQELWMEHVKVNYLGISSAVFDTELNSLSGFVLNQNYPNPFNPITKISFSVPKKAHIKIIVFDTLGKEVSTLVNEEKPSGNYSVDFSAEGLSVGIYFYQLKTKEFIETKKMILMK